MCAPIGVKSGFERQARRSDDSKNAEHQVRGGSFGNVCNVAQVIRFFPERANDELPETFEIRKRQFDPTLLSPGVGGWYRGIRHTRQSQNGRPCKINSASGNPGYADDEQSQRKPLSSGDIIELAQCKIRKQDHQ